MLKGQQAEAISFLLDWYQDPTKRVGLLQGYAGTGKTWLVGHWLEQYVLAQKPNLLVYILAPTNKALDVLREKCGHLTGEYRVSFMTIDSFLGNRIKKNDDGETETSYGKGADLPDLIVCDEGSMIKKEYDDRLRNKRVKTLYIADFAQLPPINEEISTVSNIRDTYEMTEVVRYDGAIIKVATMLRNRIKDGLLFMLPDIKQHKDDTGALSFVQIDKVYDWACTAINKGMNARIVAFENLTVVNHNRIMHSMMFPGTELFGVGEKVLVNETFEIPTGIMKYDEYDRKEKEVTVMLYNGEILTVLSCEEADPIEGVRIFNVGVRVGQEVLEVDGVPMGEDHADYILQVPLDPDHCTRVHKSLTTAIWDARNNGRSQEARELMLRRAPLNKLAPLRHSYSCTVHKSQGSTYDISFVDFASVFRCKDRARMMYVAATRPSKYLVMAYK